jgi:propanol-preferring alcohol dehydrogenase
VAVHQGRRVFAVSRGGHDLARELGAEWAGTGTPPEPLDAAIIFAPAGDLVPKALEDLAPGGTVVCAGIHMSDVPAFPYELLWRERSVRSVANLTRADGEEFLQIAPEVPVRTRVTRYALEDTAQALEDLRAGRFAGAAVVTP